MLAFILLLRVFQEVFVAPVIVSSVRKLQSFFVGFSLASLSTCIALGGSAELHLRNGDRLTGTLIRRAEGKIYFQSDLLGEITLPETEGAIVEIADMPVESLAGLPPTQPVAQVQPTPPSATKLAPASSPPSAGPAQAGAATGTASANRPSGRWKGKVEFGFQQQSGRQDLVNSSLRAEADRERGRDQLRASARVLYGEQNTRTTTDRIDASFRWRHQLSPRLFGQTVTSFTKDEIKQIDENIEQNVGVGYMVFKNDRHVANVGLGVTGQYRKAFQVDEGTTAFGEFFEDYTYRINGRLTFLQDLLAQYSPVSRSSTTLVNGSLVPREDNGENYKIRFNTTLQGKLTNRVSLNLRFEYEFDNAIANRDAKQDQRITSSLGYAF